MGYANIGGAADWWLAICVEYQGNPASNSVVNNDNTSKEYGLMWKFIKMTQGAVPDTHNFNATLMQLYKIWRVYNGR